MSGSMFVTYLWHYVAVRLIYDELVRPVAHGDAAALLIALACVVVLMTLWRR